MPVLFQGRDQTGQDRLETLAADPIGGFPQNDQCLAHRFPIGSAIHGRRLGRTGADRGQQADRMFAMAPGHRNELVEDLALLCFRDP